MLLLDAFKMMQINRMMDELESVLWMINFCVKSYLHFGCLKCYNKI